MPEHTEITDTDQHGHPGHMEIRLEPNAAERNLPGWGAWLTHDELVVLLDHGTDVTAESSLLHRLADEVETRRIEAVTAQEIERERGQRTGGATKGG